MQVDNLLLEIETKISQIESLEKENIILRENNEALKKENEDLANENIKLTEIINSSANMSDYELLKNENESLKKENSFLKRMVDKVLIYANSKIRDLINFGKPQVKQSVSFEDFESQIAVEDMASKASAYSKKDLDETVKRLQDNAKEEDKQETVGYTRNFSNR